MSRRKATRPAPLTAPDRCPCGFEGKAYAEHCGRFHSGAAAAPTAELLMRSRYSAFVVRDEAYLLRTWHPRTRPSRVGLSAATRWNGLEILGATDGSAFHSSGTVTFLARCTEDGRPVVLHERSDFARVDGDWVYVDGTFLD
ncbi:YchJ family protein [Streptomyces tsukubensis]|uniref:UPF0225 protein B1H18_04550 n=1 Tax=Streptomyces tsukubensis TaxID=83656 RepID=A0A1V4AFI4_9ACTN|nr:YchJ family metal-binding protein [Streptomyces tsukubensis]OON82307.1 hypothetical protein B1H18_04550 [Streptomyces tsukubensis]QFR92796.1 hypothetical protein GBW32_06570 [Streptomyces tsukubensis]